MEEIKESQPVSPLFTGGELKRLIIPLVIEQLLLMTVGMADTVMVTTAGEAAVSGISLVDSINLLLIQVFAALGTGGAVVVSQYLGRRDLDRACSAAKQLLYVITAVSLTLMALALLFRQSILAFLFGNIEPDVMENALVYFLLTALAYPFMSIYNVGAALFRSMGNSKVSMHVQLPSGKHGQYCSQCDPHLRLRHGGCGGRHRYSGLPGGGRRHLHGHDP